MGSHKVHGKRHHGLPAHMHMNAHILSHMYGCFCNWRTCRLPNGIAVRHWTVTNTFYSTMQHKHNAIGFYLFAERLQTRNHKRHLDLSLHISIKEQSPTAFLWSKHLPSQTCRLLFLRTEKCFMKVWKKSFQCISPTMKIQRIDYVI